MIDFLFDRSRWASELKPVGICAGAVGKKNHPPLISWQATLAKTVMVGHHPSRKNSSHGGACLPAELMRISAGRLHGRSYHVFDSPIAFTEDVARRLEVPTMDRPAAAPLVWYWEGLP